MARRVEIPARKDLDNYGAVAHLAPAVRQLREEAQRIVPKLEGKTLWMVNSTERGGGVAEMLPTLVTLFRDLGLPTEWVVLESDEPAFFALTKRLHNLIHGAGERGFSEEDRELFEKVNRENAREMAEWVSPGDLLVVHDPQPLAMASFLQEVVDLRAIWRCHIGLDRDDDRTRSAWSFLSPYFEAYERGIFSAPEYVPEGLRNRSEIIHPAIDPLSNKNRELSIHKVVGILSNAALAVAPSPVLTPMYPYVAQRLQPDGRWAPANMSEDIGLSSRPIVTQISRWDRLKGWRPLLEAFARLKDLERRSGEAGSHLHRRRLELVRLVLAGPDPESVADDPEGAEVLRELSQLYTSLPPHIQRDVALVALPMAEPPQNALMVNAIQRTSSIVVQNSIREGFGLTVTEAMWKRVPVLSNFQACGPRQQVRDGLDGRMIGDPSDVPELCSALNGMLRDYDERERWGRNAQRRTHERFLVFTQTSALLHLLEQMMARRDLPVAEPGRLPRPR